MFAGLLFRLRAIFRRTQLERDLDDELKLHLELETAKHLQAGKTYAEALRSARLALGGTGQVKEACRQSRGVALLENTGRDLVYAWRQIKRSPVFSVVVVSVLAFGIGANTAIFSLLNEVMLRSLPVKDPQRLVVAKWTARSASHPYNVGEYGACFASRVQKTEGSCSFTYPAFKRLAAQSDVFTGVAAFAGPMQFNMLAFGPAGQVRGEVVSGDFFRTLGVRPAVGRLLNQQDDRSAAPSVVVLSYGYWQSEFGGDPSAVGKTIQINHAPFVVAGVASPSFSRLSPGIEIDIWLPLHAAVPLHADLAGSLGSEHDWWLGVLGRLLPGVTQAHAEAALSAAFRRDMIERSKVLKVDSDPAIEVAPADQALIGIRQYLERPVYILMCAVALVLLIACGNVSGLLMARSAARSREMAIRAAIGAGRGRLVAQFLTESLLLAGLGALAGLVIAYACTRALSALIPWELHVQPDSRVLLFTSAVSLVCGLLLGALPALRSTRIQPEVALHRSARGLQHAMSSAGRQRGLANVLVVGQVALAVLVLAGGGLLLRTLINLYRTPTGFMTQNLLLFGLDPVSARYSDAATHTLYAALQQRLKALPGVSEVTYSGRALLSGSLSAGGVRVETRADLGEVHVKFLRVGPGYFSTMGIPLEAGRDFTASDFQNDRRAALVNHAFADLVTSGRAPLGLHYGDGPQARTAIIGMVGNTRYESLREPVAPTIYEPLRAGGASFAVRTRTNPLILAASIRRMVHELDPNLPVSNLKTQSRQIDETLFVERLVTQLAIAFGLLALLLSATGLYGLLSYEVTRRTREIGIRLAIGAAPRVVRSEVLRNTLWLVAAGLLLGLPAALLSARFLVVFLYGVPANDPVTLSAVSLLLLLVGLLAAYLPARRASRVDPLVALRCE